MNTVRTLILGAFIATMWSTAATYAAGPGQGGVVYPSQMNGESLSYDFPWVSCEVWVEASHAIYGVTGFDGRWIVRGLVVMNRLIV